jgi:hypothetical protein
MEQIYPKIAWFSTGFSQGIRIWAKVQQIKQHPAR